MAPAVPLIGLTGGLGAGKSTALAAFERLGAAVLSSDAVVHELLASDDVRDALVQRLGNEVAPGGDVDRAAVAARVFSNEPDRLWLEGLLWPRVGARAQAWVERVRADTPPPRAAVIEVPLLFEAGLANAYDATVAVIASEDVRRARAAARDHALIDERDSRQLPQEEKALLATFAVRNDGSEQDLERELSAVLAKLGG